MSEDTPQPYDQPYDHTDDTPMTRVRGAAYASTGRQSLRVTAVREGRYAKPFRPYVWRNLRPFPETGADREGLSRSG